jgi:hypothetical protein
VYIRRVAHKVGSVLSMAILEYAANASLSNWAVFVGLDLGKWKKFVITSVMVHIYRLGGNIWYEYALSHLGCS